MSDLFGSQINTGMTLSSRQRIALTIMIIIAIVVIVRWWIRTRPDDIVYLGPENVGPSTKLKPEGKWMPLMTADQIVKTAGNNITFSFFLYIKSASLNIVPMNNDGSYKFNYLLTMGDTLGVVVDPSRQTCSIDILQSAPHRMTGDTVRVKDGLKSAVDDASILRTLDVKNVLVARWNQVTVCVEGRSVDVYLNGRHSTSAILDNVPINQFSGLKLNGSPDFEGQVCLFQVWKERRTAQQILENYRTKTDLRGKPDVPDPELTFAGAWEKFLKASCEKTGFCGFRVETGPMQYVEYEFA